MNKNIPELIHPNLVTLTPLTITEIDPNSFSIKELNDSIITLRITAVQNLVRLSNELMITLESTSDVATRLALTKEMQKLYSEINNLTSKLENKSKTVANAILTADTAPYLDFTKRKSRAQTWKDYLMFCKITQTEPRTKKDFFEYVESNGFRVKLSRGEKMFAPLGVR